MTLTSREYRACCANSAREMRRRVERLHRRDEQGEVERALLAAFSSNGPVNTWTNTSPFGPLVMVTPPLPSLNQLGGGFGR